MHSLAMNEPSPHALIELSLREHKHLVHNSIHLNELCIGPCPNQIVSYTSISYGNNIRTRKSILHSNDKEQIKTNEIYISTIKKKLY